MNPVSNWSNRSRRQLGSLKMTYKPISNYGIVGDMETAALIALDGSVDWLCLPRFDSPSVFGAILDHEKGGSFTITPCGGRAHYRQLYLPDTNILVTRFLTPEGVVELTDLMPVKLNSRQQRSSWLVRRVKAVSGVGLAETALRSGISLWRTRARTRCGSS